MFLYSLKVSSVFLYSLKRKTRFRWFLKHGSDGSGSIFISWQTVGAPNAVIHRNTQMRAKERKRKTAKEERKRVQKPASASKIANNHWSRFETTRLGTPNTDPRFPCFFRFAICLVFLCVFPSFPRILRVLQKEKSLLFSGRPCFLPNKESKDWRVREVKANPMIAEERGRFSAFSGFLRCSLDPAERPDKGPKRQKKSKKKQDTDRFPGREGRRPLNPHLLHPHFQQPNPKDSVVLKILRSSELLRPNLLRCEPLFEGENACKTQENCVSAGAVAIVNDCAIVNFRKIRAIKMKSALPPPKNPKYPLPKTRNFMDMGFSCRKNAFFQASIKLTHPFPAPELRTKTLRTRGFF